MPMITMMMMMMIPMFVVCFGSLLSYFFLHVFLSSSLLPPRPSTPFPATLTSTTGILRVVS